MALVDPLPTHVDARVIYELAEGSACKDQLHKAIEWIGDRSLPLAQALEYAPAELDTRWAEIALGISGDGYAYGGGDAYRDGYAYGYGGGHAGYGHGGGYGHGYGGGDGSGYGHGDSAGYGHGYSGGYGDGRGDGYGDGYGRGDGYGDGYGLGVE